MYCPSRINTPSWVKKVGTCHVRKPSWKVCTSWVVPGRTSYLIDCPSFKPFRYSVIRFTGPIFPVLNGLTVLFAILHGYRSLDLSRRKIKAHGVLHFRPSMYSLVHHRVSIFVNRSPSLPWLIRRWDRGPWSAAPRCHTKPYKSDRDRCIHYPPRTPRPSLRQISKWEAYRIIVWGYDRRQHLRLKDWHYRG
jgi:hypothetical protein